MLGGSACDSLNNERILVTPPAEMRTLRLSSDCYRVRIMGDANAQVSAILKTCA